MKFAEIDLWPAGPNDATAHLALLTAEFRFRAVIDDQRHSLTIIRSAKSRPSLLERLRERAWRPDVRFVINGNAGDGAAMQWLSAELDAFLSMRRVEDAQRTESDIFEKWSAILRLKSDLEEQKKSPIRFDGVRVESSRIILSIQDRVADDVVGEDRLIRFHDSTTTIPGIVERVTDDRVIVYCASIPDSDELPKVGDIIADTRLAEIAIRRQSIALDALRFGRSVRPELREIIIGKQVVREPLRQPVSYFQNDLDSDKKNAVEIALAAPDLMIVEGPPGTGKTKFITEIIAQTLRRSPDARVLSIFTDPQCS